MFVKAIEKASRFLRSVQFAYRYYDENKANKSAVNIVFVNEHVVSNISKHSAYYMLT